LLQHSSSYRSKQLFFLLQDLCLLAGHPSGVPTAGSALQASQVGTAQLLLLATYTWELAEA
jgi:hypothetical protein